MSALLMNLKVVRHVEDRMSLVGRLRLGQMIIIK